MSPGGERPIRKKGGLNFLSAEGPGGSKGMDGLNTLENLVRMLERLLRADWEVAAGDTDDELRRLLRSLAGQRPWSERDGLVRALRHMAARVGPEGHGGSTGNPGGAAP